MNTINPYISDFRKEASEAAYHPPAEASTWEIFTAPFSVMKDLTKLGRAVLIGNKEAKVELIGKVARAADLTLGITQGAVQGLVFLDHLIEHRFSKQTPFSQMSTVAKIIAFPFLIFFAALSVIHTIIESIRTARSIRFLNALPQQEWKTDQGVEKQLSYIKKRFFSLDAKEVQEMQTFIDEKLPEGPLEQKAALFQKIAESSLSVKQSALIRRVSKWAADEASIEIPKIFNALATGDKTEAISRGKELLKMLKVQSEKKMVTHILNLLSITAAFASIALCFLGGLPATVTIAFVVLGILLGAVNYLVEHGMLTQRGWNFSAKECVPQFIRNVFTPTKGVLLEQEQSLIKA